MKTNQSKCSGGRSRFLVFVIAGIGLLSSSCRSPKTPSPEARPVGRLEVKVDDRVRGCELLMKSSVDKLFRAAVPNPRAQKIGWRCVLGPKGLRVVVEYHEDDRYKAVTINPYTNTKGVMKFEPVGFSD